MFNAYISGTGYYVPPRVVTNDDLSKHMDTSDEWIRERTGIQQRHFVDKGVGPSDLAIPAVNQALDLAGLSVKDIDFIIFATSTPDYYIPGSGCLLQDKMGFDEIGALDIRVQCSGFVYGLSIAEQYIKTGVFKNILLVGAEAQTTAMELNNNGRDVSVIFGDGAGAVIVSQTKEKKGILSTHMHSEGKYLKTLWMEAPASNAGMPRISSEDLKAGKQYLKMNGREVFRHATIRFIEVINECLEKNNLSIKDIDMLIPHQANLRITQMIQKKLGLSDNQVYSNIHKYGNTTAASIPIALAEAINEKKISNGDKVVLAAFGSGFAWASAVMEW
ncbi:MAG: beta-ketoacyl-ACP synthase III [Candidatus Neomarinimicrobiota bacterium]|nr:beta-ketoacyl-ACP synthase III [Candidatus Neomarinimicrobiota bacterium]|tara:strand:- start:222 stop:1217 length:996 start_codon:yes stop_codon:yes gene_type:complete